MKTLYESDDSDDIKKGIGLAALAAGIALAVKKIYDKKFKEEKALKKYGIESDRTRDIETEETLSKEQLMNIVKDESAQSAKS